MTKDNDESTQVSTIPRRLAEEFMLPTQTNRLTDLDDTNVVVVRILSACSVVVVVARVPMNKKFLNYFSASAGLVRSDQQITMHSLVL